MCCPHRRGSVPDRLVTDTAPTAKPPARGSRDEGDLDVGLIRKTMSLSTMGLVDFRSDKERTARYTRQTRNATRAQVAQNMRALDLQREQLAQAHVHHVEAQAQRIAPLNAQAVLGTGNPPPPPGPPAGWYPDQVTGVQRWWDGSRWTEHTQPLQMVATELASADLESL